MAGITYDKCSGKMPLEVHRLSAKAPLLQEKYGLWIIHLNLSGRSRAGSFAHNLPRRFEFYSLSQMIEGDGYCCFEEGEIVPVKPGDAILVPPGVLNRYGGTEDAPYVEDSICFSGELADRLLDCGVIKAGIFHMGSARRLLDISKKFNDPDPGVQLLANADLQHLLVELFASVRRRNNDVLDSILEQINTATDHWWTVSELCSETGIVSPDRLRKAFLERTGMLPKAYIEDVKMRRARTLLVSGDLEVREIASRLGYFDAGHFSRRFKANVGLSPENYRRKFKK